MLVYEKYVTETVGNEQVKVRHLFGTEANVPSDSDNQLVYQDADGDTVTPSLENKYFDDGNGGIKMIDSEGNETFLAVNINKGTAQSPELVNIIPGGAYEPVEKVLKSVRIETAKNTKKNYTVGEELSTTGIKLFAIFASGEEENVTADADFYFDDSEATTVTADDTAVIGSYTYDEVTKTDSFDINVEAASDPTPEG